MKFMGEDRILFGTDSVWYGSPQWQIEALWRFQIPEEMRKKYGYPELTEQAKRNLLVHLIVFDEQYHGVGWNWN